MSDFSFSFERLTIYRPVLDHMLNSPDGDVGRYLAARGRLVVLAAKRQVGADTGALRASITMIHTRSAGGQYLKIGSNNKVALVHHQGSRPHLITPRNQQGMLRFQAGGRVIYTRRVMHPGTRPNRYLSDNLKFIRS